MDSAAASNPEASQPSSDLDPESPDDPESMASAEGKQPDASKPDQGAKDDDGTGGASQGDGLSRRSRPIVAKLTKERDDLLAEVTNLRAAVTVPEHVRAAMRTAMLEDGEFARLEDKLKREDISGDYLTTEERQQYTTALQVREWLGPAIQEERQKAATWVQGQRAQLFNAQAEALAPVLRAREYLKPEVISKAATWQAIYDHLCDAAHEAGRKAERAELQPQLDRVHDLEAENLSLRTGSVHRGQSLERGGTSGGAYNARPDWETAKPSDYFGAAIAESEQRRSRRAVRAR